LWLYFFSSVNLSVLCGEKFPAERPAQTYPSGGCASLIVPSFWE
jgi:hypothetical protein